VCSFHLLGSFPPVASTDTGAPGNRAVCDRPVSAEHGVCLADTTSEETVDMIRLARWCFAHRRTVLAAWLLLLVVALGAARAAGGSFNSDLSLPGTDSQAAVSLLTQHYPAAAGETDQVVIQATGGATIESAPVRGAVTAALARVSALPGIASVTSPYTTGGSQVSRVGTVAFARVTWDMQPAEVTAADARALIAAAQTADGRACTCPSEGRRSRTPSAPSLGRPWPSASSRRWSSC
jgi:hypothetical protein